MSVVLPPRIPSYRLHKPSGRAVVTIHGKDHYLGRFKTLESQQEYARLIAQWSERTEAASTSAPASASPTVNELILAYIKHCLVYYQNSPREIEKIKLALKVLRQAYSAALATDFGPLALKSFQLKLARSLSRRTVNMRVDIVRRLFKWAVSDQKTPVTIYQALMTVEGLRRGRSIAKEGKRIQPVSDDIISGTLPFLNSHLAAMVRLQRLTGARSGRDL
jgi:hypothetical protein